jgi:hypothetical protein
MRSHGSYRISERLRRLWINPHDSTKLAGWLAMAEISDEL